VRILHVIQFFSPNRGGSVTAACGLAVRLSEMKHEVTIATTDYDFDTGYADYVIGRGARLISFPCRLNISDFLVSPRMNTWLGEHSSEFDVIHMHNFRTYQNAVAYRWSTTENIPFVLQPDNSVPRVISRKGAKWLFDVAIGNKMLKRANRIVAISQEETRYLESLGVETRRIAQIYTGIDTESFSQLPARGRFRDKMGLDRDVHLITYLGRIHKTKGLDSLLRAFALVRKKYFSKLVIIGRDDGFKEELLQIAASLNVVHDVLLVGPVGEREKIAAYVDSDVFVHPVKYMGGVGISPLEALMCETPVVVTKECAEIIEESDSGYILDSHDDVAGLAAAIEQVLSHPDEARNRARMGREYIKERLSWERVAKEVEGVYEDCIRDFQ
jgi:glycosyltransferase involved in cell wall biosynthesis